MENIMSRHGPRYKKKSGGTQSPVTVLQEEMSYAVVEYQEKLDVFKPQAKKPEEKTLINRLSDASEGLSVKLVEGIELPPISQQDKKENHHPMYRTVPEETYKTATVKNEVLAELTKKVKTMEQEAVADIQKTPGNKNFLSQLIKLVHDLFKRIMDAIMHCINSLTNQKDATKNMKESLKAEKGDLEPENRIVPKSK